MKKNKNLYITTFILSIWNLILFYGHYFGISLILFNIPTVLLIDIILYRQNKIHNKYGLLFGIPIILLSISYLLYTSTITLVFNFIAIILFYILMIMYTVNKDYHLSNILENILNIIFLPLDKLNDMMNDLFSYFPKKEKKEKKQLSKETQNTIISIIIGIPIVIIILYLLSSADMMFGKIFESFFTGIEKFLEQISDIEISDLTFKIIFRFIYFFIFFIYFTSSMYFLKKNYDKKNYVEKEKKYSELTIKPLLFILNIIYILFDFIQIRSLMFHKVSMDITYAEYARQGFFQLMFVSLINMIIILIAKKFNKKDAKANRILSSLMILLTAVIVISSFLRMNMYEAAYGYTVLRLIVYCTLITELILMIPTLLYVLKEDFNIIKYYLIIITIIYTIIGIAPLDKTIANRNIEKYYKDQKIDIHYLMNNNYDNIPTLIDFYDKLEDQELKTSLNEYFISLKDNIEEHNFFSEYNIARKKGIDRLKYRNFEEERNQILIDPSYINKIEYQENNLKYEIYTYNKEIDRKETYQKYRDDYEIETILYSLDILNTNNRLRKSDLTLNDFYNLIYDSYYDTEEDKYHESYNLYYYDAETYTLHHIILKEE